MNQSRSYSEKFIICLNCRRYCFWDEMQCNCCGEPIPNKESREEDNIEEDNIIEQIVYKCPHCDGNKTEIDDDDPNGTKTCYYCDGKGWVSYDDAEAYREHDPNLM